MATLDLQLLQPIEVIWEDASWIAGWHTIAQGSALTPSEITTRGYHIAIANGNLLVAQHHGNHKVNGAMVANVTAIPMCNIKSITPRRESFKEKLVRLKGVKVG